jgi:hypothetical protein
MTAVERAIESVPAADEEETSEVKESEEGA